MAGSHSRRSDRWQAPFPLRGGGYLAIARDPSDIYVLAVTAGAVHQSVTLTRSEVRELGLRLVESSQEED
jgi:hypothetical protein